MEMYSCEELRLYLRAPAMAGVQSCCVVFLYALVHTQMGHIGIAYLEHIKKM